MIFRKPLHKKNWFTTETDIAIEYMLLPDDPTTQGGAAERGTKNSPPAEWTQEFKRFRDRAATLLSSCSLGVAAVSVLPGVLLLLFVSCLLLIPDVQNEQMPYCYHHTGTRT